MTYTPPDFTACRGVCERINDNILIVMALVPLSFGEREPQALPSLTFSYQPQESEASIPVEFKLQTTWRGHHFSVAPSLDLASFLVIHSE